MAVRSPVISFPVATCLALEVDRRFGTNNAQKHYFEIVIDDSCSWGNSYDEIISTVFYLTAKVSRRASLRVKIEKWTIERLVSASLFRIIHSLKGKAFIYYIASRSSYNISFS